MYKRQGNSGKIWEGEIWNDGRANGFKGVFDGRGYVIKGFHLAARAGGGLFGIIHTDGVVKNVAFSNAVHDGWSGFIASGGNGRIENVYISCDVQSGGNNIDKSGFFYSQEMCIRDRPRRCPKTESPPHSTLREWQLLIATIGLLCLNKEQG